MKLTKIAILALRGCSKDVKQKIADSLGVTLPSVYRWIDNNDDNLTKSAALQIIGEETGLKEDQILEETESVS